LLPLHRHKKAKQGIYRLLYLTELYSKTYILCYNNYKGDEKMETDQRKGNGLKWILLIVIIFFAAMTNPDKTDFKDYLSEEMSEEVNGDDWLANLLGNTMIDLLVETSVTDKDYVIFTTFEVEIDNETKTFIGLFNNFIKIN